jgi:putative RecB family exonuclease
MNKEASLVLQPQEPHGSNYVSASRLNTWLACPLKFKLKFVDGVSKPMAVGEFVNRMVYAGLEHYYRQKQAGEPLGAAELSQHVCERWKMAALASGVRFTSPEEEQVARQQTLNLLSAYLGRVPSVEPRPMEVKRYLEAPLIDPDSGKDLGLVLGGTVDLLVPEANGPLIVAFKVVARNNPPLETAVEIQLACLAYLLRNAYGIPETGFELCQLVKTKAPQVIWQRYAPREEIHFRRLFAAVQSYLDGLAANRFFFRPDVSCGWCDFRDEACQEWLG